MNHGISKWECRRLQSHHYRQTVSLECWAVLKTNVLEVFDSLRWAVSATSCLDLLDLRYVERSQCPIADCPSLKSKSLFVKELAGPCRHHDNLCASGVASVLLSNSSNSSHPWQHLRDEGLWTAKSNSKSRRSWKYQAGRGSKQRPGQPGTLSSDPGSGRGGFRARARAQVPELPELLWFSVKNDRQQLVSIPWNSLYLGALYIPRKSSNRSCWFSQMNKLSSSKRIYSGGGTMVLIAIQLEATASLVFFNI